jgi:hypothetical protein
MAPSPRCSSAGRAWVDVLREALRDGGAAHVEILLRYTLRVAGREPFDRFYQTIIDLASGEEDIMITAAESYYQEGRERGLEEGRERGLEEGRERGLEEGRERGLEEGRERGLEEGLRRALEEVLVQRFGPLRAGDRARLEQAAPATLQRWLGRAVAAASLDDVLAGE